MNMKKILRGPIIYILLAIVAVWIGSSLITASGFKEVSTQEGLELLSDGKVAAAKIVDGENRVDLTLAKADEELGTQVQFYYVTPRGDDVVDADRRRRTRRTASTTRCRSRTGSSRCSASCCRSCSSASSSGSCSRACRAAATASCSSASPRRSSSRKESPKVTFDDVAGADEAIEELHEIKEFLKEPAKFQAVGARIPKGVLLYGPPGTGKTLLARAVAGEAGVPFYSISGSDFVEMFVGVGASRVRDLFDQAKQNAPAIIFVDEIDAVGRHRGAGIGGGHDEREQTLNQLLVEMDGFDPKTNVILIAATNRPDILDPALLRPGRFDRQIGVDAPDLKGRKQHPRGARPRASRSPRASTSRCSRARRPGFTGADLANVLNEAALLTARSNAQLIDNRALDEAVDRVIAGPQRRTRVMKDKEKLITAYHEGGHALAAAAMNYTDPVTKVTILPRGRALGYTMVLPLEDKYSVTPQRAARPAHVRDGRPRRRGDRVPRPDDRRLERHREGHRDRPQDGHRVRHERERRRRSSSASRRARCSSAATWATSATTPRRSPRRSTPRCATLIEQAHDEAWQVLNANRDILDKLAAELLEKETLDHNQLAEIFKDVKQLPRAAAVALERRAARLRPPADRVPAREGADRPGRGRRRRRLGRHADRGARRVASAAHRPATGHGVVAATA